MRLLLVPIISLLLPSFLLAGSKPGNAGAKTETFCTYTGLSGFYDYQSTGRSPQYIRMDPATGVLHVIMMVADDSTNLGSSRRTAYAYSTDQGGTWSTFNQVRIPARISGFPSLDLGQGPLDGAAIIVNHNDGGGGTASFAYVDFPVGGGAFAELAALPSMGESLLWPEVACTSNGSIFIAASSNSNCRVYITNTRDYTTWGAWDGRVGATTCGNYVLEANANGRIALVLNATFGGIFLIESTDNGVNWPDSAVQIVTPDIVVGGDTFHVSNDIDLTYRGDEPLIAFSLYQPHGVNSDNAGIGYWSRSTGFVFAVPHNAIPRVVDTLGISQNLEHSVAGATIGRSGQTILIGFHAFMPETSAAGYNYADAFLVHSPDGGLTWSSPANLSHSLYLDERYVSLSKYNPPDTYDIVWQEDPSPSSSIFSGDPTVDRVRQVFCSDRLTHRNELPDEPYAFDLMQNYPNPFNPGTEIIYQIPERSRVTLSVYNMLGQEVLTLVNEIKQPGTYTVKFDASGLASGVYIYKLQAGNVVASKKLLLLR